MKVLNFFSVLFFALLALPVLATTLPYGEVLDGLETMASCDSGPCAEHGSYYLHPEVYKNCPDVPAAARNAFDIARDGAAMAHRLRSSAYTKHEADCVLFKELFGRLDDHTLSEVELRLRGINLVNHQVPVLDLTADNTSEIMYDWERLNRLPVKDEMLYAKEVYERCNADQGGRTFAVTIYEFLNNPGFFPFPRNPTNRVQNYAGIQFCFAGINNVTSIDLAGPRSPVRDADPNALLDALTSDAAHPESLRSPRFWKQMFDFYLATPVRTLLHELTHTYAGN